MIDVRATVALADFFDLAIDHPFAPENLKALACWAELSQVDLLASAMVTAANYAALIREHFGVEAAHERVAVMRAGALVDSTFGEEQ